MTEERKTIDFSEDKRMVAYADKLVGMQRILLEYAQEKGRLERELANYTKKKYGVTFRTHTIETYALKLVPRKEGG